MRKYTYLNALLLGSILVTLLNTSENVATILERQTSELLHAIDTGSPAVWERYLRPDAVFTDENGTVYTKPELIRQIRPFPPGVSGQLALQDFHVRVAGSTAVATYLIDEHEVFHGHPLHCQYRNTDTWSRDGTGWHLLAYQALALRTDPPSIALSETELAEYVGVYSLSPTKTYEIRVKDGHLEGQEMGRPPETLFAEVPDILFVPGKPRYRKVILRGPDQRVTGFAERREAWDLIWTRMP